MLKKKIKGGWGGGGDGHAEEMHAHFLGKGRAKSCWQTLSTEVPFQAREPGFLLWGSEVILQKVIFLNSSFTLK